MPNNEISVTIPQLPLWFCIVTPIVLWYIAIVVLCRFGFFQKLLFTEKSMFGGVKQRTQGECGAMVIFSPITVPFVMLFAFVSGIGAFCSRRKING